MNPLPAPGDLLVRLQGGSKGDPFLVLGPIVVRARKPGPDGRGHHGRRVEQSAQVCLGQDGKIWYLLDQNMKFYQVIGRDA